MSTLDARLTALSSSQPDDGASSGIYQPSTFTGMRYTTVCPREDIKLDITGWEEEEEALKTRWRFSAILSLPWHPRLAAAGGTTHVFSKVQSCLGVSQNDWMCTAAGRTTACLALPVGSVALLHRLWHRHRLWTTAGGVFAIS